MSINRDKIQNALSYVHFWEKNGKTRVEAAKEAVGGIDLNEIERDILLNAIHVKKEELSL